ncbi:MAG: hypothetical protein GY954_06590, partial [Alteromonas sp.]|nr:hypothetical protein [Alteromonas sp.]
MPDVQDVEGYSPFVKNSDGKSDIDGYEKYADSFSDSFNPQTTAAIKSNINREIRNQNTLANGGALGVAASVAASVAAGVADPINLATMMLPGYDQANMWKVAGQSMAVGAVASSAQEIALHSTQETRTLDESMFNVGVGAIADGLLGAGIAKLTGSEKEVVTNAISKQWKSEETRSVGAAEVASYGGKKRKKVMETQNPLTKLALFSTKAFPVGRTLQSDSPIVRGTAQ